MKMLWIAVALLGLAGCSRTVIGPDIPIRSFGGRWPSSPGVHQRFDFIENGFNGEYKVFLSIRRLGGGKAEYKWSGSRAAEKAIAMLLTNQAKIDIMRDKHTTNFIIGGDCIIFQGKKYCTGRACRL